MKYQQLGPSQMRVSSICLGTMTWGEQNTEKEAHAQLDYAFERGVNFLDTAEMYPIPPKEETYASTERMIGRWHKMGAQRDKIIVATKIAGPGLDYIRGGSSFSKEHLWEAAQDSLSRLKTDYIDLYQLHWPERNTNVFGKLGLTQLHPEESFTPFLHILEGLSELQNRGKIREFGVSNETPWGMMKFLETASRFGLPQPVSIQNPYSLLNRSYEVGLSEISLRENRKLLAYSPLGFGVLTGKYLDKNPSPQARLSLFPQYTRYTNSQACQATRNYVELALEYQLIPSQMALAFVASRSFVVSTIIGATNLEQLEENINSIELSLSPEVQEKIDNIHRTISNPAP